MWKNGTTLVPDNTSFSRKHEILRFDDATGTLWAAYDKESTFVPLHLDVIQKMGSSGQLTAFSNLVVKNLYIGTNILRIKTDKNKGMVFLNYASEDNEITTGQCHIGKPYP